jgi:dolichol-phosphate mannosyltransferase
MNNVSIIIPALNERPNLELLIPRIASTCGNTNIDWEAIVVDSNSEDGTADLITRFSDTLPVRLLNEPVRGDLARAWRRGIEASKYPCIISMDADLCHTPEFIPELLAALDTADIVVASRYLSQERRKWTKSLHQELASRLGQRFCRLALRLPSTDISHGFRAFRKELYERLKNDITTPGNTFLIDFIYHAHRTGARIREIPYVYGKRLHGKDHLKVSRESMRFFAFTLSVWRKR